VPKELIEAQKEDVSIPLEASTHWGAARRRGITLEEGFQASPVPLIRIDFFMTGRKIM